MSIKRAWRSLDVAGRHPHLFLKADLDVGSCSFQLTDLNRLWGVKLGKDAVVASANGQGTSIDPGEDVEQYHQFLATVNSALNGDSQTHVGLRSGYQPESLQLVLVAPLPGSLPSFKWTVDLIRQENNGSTMLQSELLSPLLAYTNHLRSQIQHLVEELGHKDRVISKITDKLETTGNDLTQVFPGVSNVRISRKKSQRSQLASHINGLADFDEAKFRSQAIGDMTSGEPSVEEIDAIFGEMSQSGTVDAPGHGDDPWWHVIEGTSSDRLVDLYEHEETEKRTSEPSRIIHPATEESSLQRQASQRLNESSSQHEDDAETEDEDDLDAPTRKASQARAETRVSSPPSYRTPPHGNSSSSSQQINVGVHGNTSKPTNDATETVATETAEVSEAETNTDIEEPEPPRESLAPVATSRTQAEVEGHATRAASVTASDKGDTATDADLEQKQRAEVKKQPQSGQNRKLGNFSGKRRVGSPGADARVVDPTLEQPKPPERRSRLGTFAGKAKKLSQSHEAEGTGDVGSKGGTTVGALESGVGSQDSVEERGRSLPTPNADGGQQERANSEDRAREKRERLKKELDEKGRAPVKKKRKY